MAKLSKKQSDIPVFITTTSAVDPILDGLKNGGPEQWGISKEEYEKREKTAFAGVFAVGAKRKSEK